MARLVPAALIALAITFATPHLLACDCPRGSTSAEHDVVFYGEATQVRGSGRVRATIEVERIIEGSVPPEIVVSTPGSSAECGTEFSRGKNYYVFAARSDDGWRTDRCMGTRLHAEVEVNEAALRKAGVKPSKIRAIKKIRQVGSKHAQAPAGATAYYDVSPPDAGFEREDPLDAVANLEQALIRPHTLGDMASAHALADKYVPSMVDGPPRPRLYSDDAYRILEGLYEAGDCESLLEHAEKLQAYTGPYQIQVDRWRTHCSILEGDFAGAREISGGLDDQVGYDERTDQVLFALASFLEQRDSLVSENDAGFDQFLDDSREVRFSTKDARLDVLSALSDLLGDTQLLRSPQVLTAVADIPQSLPSLKYAGKALRAEAMLRAARLVDDEQQRQVLEDEAQVAHDPDHPELFETLRHQIDALPMKKPDYDARPDNETSAPEASEDDSAAASTSSPHEKPPANARHDAPQEDDSDQALSGNTSGMNDMLIIGAVSLGAIALILVMLALFRSDEDDE